MVNCENLHSRREPHVPNDSVAIVIKETNDSIRPRLKIKGVQDLIFAFFAALFTYHEVVLRESDSRPLALVDLVPDLDLDFRGRVSDPDGVVLAGIAGAAGGELEL